MKNHPIIIALLLMLLTLTTCHKDKEFDMKDAVVSNEEVIVLETQARFSWEVDFEGHFQTGVEVSPNENMAEARRVEAMKEDEGFAVVVDSLSMGTKYYYSIVVWNKFSRYEHLMGDFTTKMSYTILVSADEGGTVTGGGTYIAGDTCTVVATANAGYNFVNWTENGEQVSSEEEYTFIVTDDRDLVANFTSQQYTITATANPTDGGSVTGGGTYYEGAQCTVTAIPADGYTFTTWYEVYLDEGGVSFVPVSTDASYTFTVNSDRTLEANFSVQAPNTYNIDVSANPSNGGTVSGGGTYQQGQQCTVTATANDGYTFLRWTENGSQVSTNANYTFTVTGNRTLVAQFQVQSYTITASANPTNGGSVSGGGSYDYGQSCTLTVTAATVYTFLRWTENGSQVSTNPNYTFTVTGNRTLVAQFQVQSYIITASANPTNGGSVSGGGSYDYGQSCTLTATAATGYTFLRWTENGSQVSTNANYTFTVTSSRTLVAQFQAQSYTISVSANPTNGGTVTGGGTYQQGQSCTVSATANSNYTFTNWTENGSVVSTQTNYTFTVTGNRTLVANFTYNGGGNAPTGAIDGLFSVSATQQVYFSQGNLQYQASTNTWKFAENQYDYIGSDNSNISSTYSGWIDLFGWGTSGWNSGNTYYHPWDSDRSDESLYGPPGQYDLTGSYANADWGVYNPISNGGNIANQWCTITLPEWDYVFNTRTTTSGIRYAKANVNNVNGVILLPDDWSTSTYSLGSTNTYNVGFSSNTISSSQWTILENAGAVFLPAAGYRLGTSVGNVGSRGLYWSASCYGNIMAYDVYFDDPSLSMYDHSYRYYGRSVRLVRVAE